MREWDKERVRHSYIAREEVTSEKGMINLLSIQTYKREKFFKLFVIDKTKEKNVFIRFVLRKIENGWILLLIIPNGWAVLPPLSPVVCTQRLFFFAAKHKKRNFRKKSKNLKNKNHTIFLYFPGTIKSINVTPCKLLGFLGDFSLPLKINSHR